MKMLTQGFLSVKNVNGTDDQYHNVKNVCALCQ